ncbi:MAG: DUF1295 domain-containing protein [Nitrospiraceae bacterium]|nr:DUF1295 domain-containing protein [Nitrospiraceae bacterium]
MDPVSLLIHTWLGGAVLMVLLWLLQERCRNASVGDVGWCYGLAGSAIWCAWHVSGEPARRVLVAMMVCIYAVRLGTHVLVDRVWNKQEDPRYRSLREQWGTESRWRMALYFQLQALALPLFVLPAWLVMQNPHPPFHLWELAGLLLWGVAVSGEAIADWQLASFRSKSWNVRRVCRVGLWYYSRHPNYFFEWLHWWSYALMGVALPMGNWGLTLIGPVAMGVALLKVTGIPWAEAQASASRGEEYAAYQRTTNAFFPWFPKKSG